jgi:hypothetical protein
MVLPDENGCLVFQGAVNSKGYGCLGAGLVHRLAWESFNGPIRDGWEIHHECKNKLCCNIDHLACMSKVDHAELEGRGQKLTEVDVLEMLDLLAGGASRTSVASAFGVSLTTVTDTRHGRAWRRVVAAYYRSAEAHRRDLSA